jgi:adenosine deaminase
MDLTALPKTELHLHLEGAIPKDAFLGLIHKYGGADQVPDLAGLNARLQYRDFTHFLASWIWMTGYLREYQDFTRIARGVATELMTQGVRYAEIFYSPSLFRRHGLTLQGITTAVRSGFDAVKGAPAVRLILDLSRNEGPELGLRLVEEAAEVAAETGIVGLGLGGPELEFPPEPYTGVYRRAGELGLHRVAHAGEAAGPESVWGAIRALGSERIGHGVRSIEDAELVAHLSERRIPLEICPTSNLRTGVVQSIERHPIRRLFEAGVPITLSSDDPTFFGADILDEYRLLRDVLGFSDAELVLIARTGFEHAFASPEERAGMLAEFDAETRTDTRRRPAPLL